MTNVIYHVIDVWSVNGKPIESKTVYNHAIGLAEKSENLVLFCHQEPPKVIKGLVDSYHIISGTNSITQITSALNVVGEICDEKEDWRYISTYHYVPSISGFLSDLKWIVDANENPRKMVLTEQGSKLNHIVNPIYRLIIDRADIVVQTSHPSDPDKYGKRTRYVRNGAVIPKKDQTDNNHNRFQDIKMVWTGAKKGTEIVLEALSLMDYPRTLDIFGTLDNREEFLVDKFGIEDNVDLRGRVEYSTLMNEMQTYTIGLCVLPARQDFIYAHPLKVGEYLANGLIPVLSDFPGMRGMARDAGIYTDPTPTELANTLDELVKLKKSELTSMSERSRERAEDIDWEKERQWFAEQAIF